MNHRQIIRDPILHMNKLNAHISEIKLKTKKIPELTIPNQEKDLNKQNAVLILMANRKDPNSKFGKMPYDVVKIIAKEVAKPSLLKYLHIIINGQEYRLHLEPVLTLN